MVNSNKWTNKGRYNANIYGSVCSNLTINDTQLDDDGQYICYGNEKSPDAGQLRVTTKAAFTVTLPDSIISTGVTVAANAEISRDENKIALYVGISFLILFILLAFILLAVLLILWKKGISNGSNDP